MTYTTTEHDRILPDNDKVFDPNGDLQDSLDELGALEESLKKSLIAAESLQMYGARQDLLFLFTQTGLSTGTLSSSVESFGSEEAYLCALEDIKEQSEQTSKSWAAKAVSLVGSFIKKIGEKFKSLTEKVSARVKSAGTKIKTTAQVHPYATAAVVVAGLVATGGALGVARSALSAKTLSTAAGAEQAGGRIAAAFSRIRFPFGKLNVVAKGAKLTETVAESAPQAKVAAGAGGWTMSSIKLFSDGITRGASAVYEGVKSLGAAIVSLLSSGWKAVAPHLHTTAKTADHHVGGAIQYTQNVAANHKNFIVRLGAGMVLFSFTKYLITLVVKSINWIVNGVTKFVKGTVNAICGSSEDEKQDEALAY